MDRIKQDFFRPARKRAGYFYIQIVFAVTLIICSFLIFSNKASAAELSHPIRICIDPGHGGENLGAEWKGYTEKEITLITALSMKNELEKYDNVEVFLTRTVDDELSLQERADYAKDINADFLFCLHYNMSEEHDFYGAECWISAFGDDYARGMDFARIEMEELTSLGLYDRGIKTRLNQKGINYYGILRASEEYHIPGIIIEHCHLDHYRDEPFYDAEGLFERFGVIDATAVAKYYQLKSDSLGVDYSEYDYDPTPSPTNKVAPDETEPEYCNLSVGEYLEIDEIDKKGDISKHPTLGIRIDAHDSESRLLYYSYSLDSGLTWSELYPYQNMDGTYSECIDTQIDLVYDRPNNIVVRTYNLHCLYTDSDVVQYQTIPSPIEEVIETEEEVASVLDEYEDVTLADTEVTEEEHIDYFIVFMFVFIAVLILLGIVLGVFLLITRPGARKVKNRRHRRNGKS